MAKKQKKNIENPRLTPCQTIARILYFLTFVGSIIFGLSIIPYKQLPVDFLSNKGIQFWVWQFVLKSLNIRFTLLVTVYISLIIGLLYIGRFLWFKFLTTKETKVPILNHLPFVPPVQNPFYNSTIPTAKTLKELKEEAKKVRVLERQLNEQRQAASGTEDLEGWFFAFEEVLKSMKVLSHLLNSNDDEVYKTFFLYGMKEAANTIIKVTSGNCHKYSSIMMVNEDENAFTIVGSNGIPIESLNKKFKKGEGFAGKIWESKEPKICPDVDEDECFQDGYSPDGTYHSIVGVPVFDLGDNVIGAMFTQASDKNIFQQTDVSKLSYFAKLLSIYLMDYQRKQRVERDGQSNLAEAT